MGLLSETHHKMGQRLVASSEHACVGRRDGCVVAKRVWPCGSNEPRTHEVEPNHPPMEDAMIARQRHGPRTVAAATRHKHLGRRRRGESLQIQVDNAS